MICELCGKNFNRVFKIRLEGGLVSACEGCAKFGEVVAEIKPQIRAPKPAPQIASRPAPAAIPASKEEEATPELVYGLIEDFGSRIKAARERLKLTQEELGKVLNESHTVIHRMELGKLEPTEDMARKLERKLNVRLIVLQKDDDDSEVKPGQSKEVTLGDMIVVRKRGK